MPIPCFHMPYSFSSVINRVELYSLQGYFQPTELCVVGGNCTIMKCLFPWSQHTGCFVLFAVLVIGAHGSTHVRQVMCH